MSTKEEFKIFLASASENSVSELEDPEEKIFEKLLDDLFELPLNISDFRTALYNLMPRRKITEFAVDFMMAIIVRHRYSNKVDKAQLHVLIEYLRGALYLQLIPTDYFLRYYEYFFEFVHSPDLQQSSILHLIFMISNAENLKRYHINRLRNGLKVDKKSSKSKQAVLLRFYQLKPMLMKTKPKTTKIDTKSFPQIPALLRKNFILLRGRCDVHNPQAAKETAPTFINLMSFLKDAENKHLDEIDATSVYNAFATKYRSLLLLMGSEAVRAKFVELINTIFIDIISNDENIDEKKEFFGHLCELQEYLDVQQDVVTKSLYYMVPRWNGDHYKAEMFSVLKYLPIKSFCTFYKYIFKPLYDLALEFKSRMFFIHFLNCMSEIIHNNYKLLMPTKEVTPSYNNDHIKDKTDLLGVMELVDHLCKLMMTAFMDDFEVTHTILNHYKRMVESESIAYASDVIAIPNMISMRVSLSSDFLAINKLADIYNESFDMLFDRRIKPDLKNKAAVIFWHELRQLYYVFHMKIYDTDIFQIYADDMLEIILEFDQLPSIYKLKNHPATLPILRFSDAGKFISRKNQSDDEMAKILEEYMPNAMGVFFKLQTYNHMGRGKVK